VSLDGHVAPRSCLAMALVAESFDPLPNVFTTADIPRDVRTVGVVIPGVAGSLALPHPPNSRIGDYVIQKFQVIGLGNAEISETPSSARRSNRINKATVKLKDE